MYYVIRALLLPTVMSNTNPPPQDVCARHIMAVGSAVALLTRSTLPFFWRARVFAPSGKKDRFRDWYLHRYDGTYVSYYVSFSIERENTMHTITMSEMTPKNQNTE